MVLLGIIKENIQHIKEEHKRKRKKYLMGKITEPEETDKMNFVKFFVAKNKYKKLTVYRQKYISYRVVGENDLYNPYPKKAKEVMTIEKEDEHYLFFLFSECIRIMIIHDRKNSKKYRDIAVKKEDLKNLMKSKRRLEKMILAEDNFFLKTNKRLKELEGRLQDKNEKIKILEKEIQKKKRNIQEEMIYVNENVNNQYENFQKEKQMHVECAFFYDQIDEFLRKNFFTHKN